VSFVTRLKDNAQYQVVTKRPIPENRTILSDQLIRFTGHNAVKRCPYLLRRVVVWDSINQQDLVLLTNHLEYSNLDSTDCHAADQIPAVQVNPGLVAVKPGGPAALEPV
jgi:hypothetical protein